MGSDDSTGAKLAVRCCQGAYFAVGFVVTTVTFAVMFWIVWCYFGIAVVHISDSQRRALVNYSYTTKPQPTPTSPAPRLESSITNSIVKSTVDGAAVVNRGSSAAHPAPSISTNQSPVRAKDDKDKAAPEPILNASSEELSEEEGLYVRRVSSEVGDNNRPDTALPVEDSGGRRSTPEKDSNRRIEPSQAHDDGGRSRKPEELDRGKTAVDEIKPAARDQVDKDSPLPTRRDDIPPSRRRDSESTYDESDYPRRYEDDSDRGRSRRRYSEGERRTYADDDRSVEKERDRRPVADDRYYDDRLPDRSRTRDDRYTGRYPEDTVRRSDDDRYYRDRDYDDRRKEERPLVRGSETKRRLDEDDKYVRRDERYRDDDRYSEEERYRRRGGVGYSSRDDDEKYRARDEDRYRDERDRPYVPRKPLIRDTDDRKEYIPSSERVRDRDYRDPPVSSRTDTDRPLRSDRPIAPSYDDRIIENPRVLEDRDKSYAIDDIAPSRVDTPPRIPENRYKGRDDEYRRPTRYDTLDDDIRPTKTRDVDYVAPPSISSSRPRNDERYIDDSRRRDSGYYDEELKRRDDGTRGIPIGGTRRVVQDDEYRTRVPNEKREEVVLDRRSYASEEDDYRRSDSRTRTAYDDDRVRRPYNDDRRDYESPKRAYVEERPSRPVRVDDDFDRSRPRGDYDSSRTRQRDRPDDDYRRYDRDDDRYVPRGDDKYIPRDDDRYPRDERPASTVREYSRYPEDTSRAKPRDSDRLASGRDTLPRSDDRDIRSRPDRYDDIPPRTDTRDPYAYSENRKYDDVPPSSQGSRVSKDVYESGGSAGSRRNLESSSAKEPLIGPPLTSSAYSKEPSRVFLREKRYQVTESSKGEDLYSETRGTRRDQPESFVERPFDVKDVIGTAIRQTDGERQNKKVHYPVLDPRISNLTSPDVIRASERRGTTITAKRRRKRTMEYILPK